MSRDIPINLIDRDEAQPRQHFDPAALDELAQSIATSDLIVPILVRPAGERFIIVHGERRCRAVQSLGWETIPADVRDVSEDEAHWMALIENVQRSDLSPIEEARAYQARLADGITQEQLGQRIGKTQSYIAQKLRLLTLPDPVLVLLDRKALSEGHARQLLRLRALYHDMTMTVNDATDGKPLTAERFRPVLMDAKTAEGGLLALLYSSIRIEDQPIGYLLPRDDQMLATMRESFLAFLDYTAERNNTIPLWGLAAFWWGALAAWAPWSVAALSKQIDLWHERFLAAIYWKYIGHRDESIGKYLATGARAPVNADKHPLSAMREMEYWGYEADLRHGGVLDYVDTHDLPHDLKIEAYHYITKKEGKFALPTQVQPWGENHEEYQKHARRLQELRDMRD